MNYFSIEFSYELPRVPVSRGHYGDGVMVHVNMGPPEENPALNKALIVATAKAEKAFKKLDLEYVHEYAWPGDGNFYKIIRTKKSETDVQQLLEAEGCTVVKFWPCHPDEKKHGICTPRQRFRHQAARRKKTGARKRKTKAIVRKRKRRPSRRT